MQYNGQYENYNNPKLNVVQDQNIKTVIGSEIEKKVPLIKETFVPLNPIANQPTFGYLRFPFFKFFFLNQVLQQSVTKNQKSNTNCYLFLKQVTRFFLIG